MPHKTVNTRIKTAIFTIAIILGAQPVCAAVSEVQYKAFYSHVRKLNSDDTQALQFAFGFKHIDTGELCVLNKVHISTQKQQIPVEVSPEQRFTMPSERALNLANAVVVIDLAAPTNKCDMSVQLETKAEYLKSEYTHDELVFIYGQYQAFFNEMGSFLSFMMPSVKGLMFHFSDSSLTQAIDDQTQITQGTLVLKEAWLDQKKDLVVPAGLLRITALAAK